MLRPGMESLPRLKETGLGRPAWGGTEADTTHGLLSWALSWSCSRHRDDVTSETHIAHDTTE